MVNHLITGLGVFCVIVGLYWLWRGLKTDADLLKVPDKKQKVK